MEHRYRLLYRILIGLTREYSVSSKREIAERLWKVSRSVEDDRKLLEIIRMLPEDRQIDMDILLQTRKKHPTTDYRGLWEPEDKPVSKMGRDEVIRVLRQFRSAWKDITGRDEDLDDERLSTEGLRRLLGFYYSRVARSIAEDWLRG